MSPSPAIAARAAGHVLNKITISKLLMVILFAMAGPRGLEPRSTVLETGILPLNYRPVIWIPFGKGGYIVGERCCLVNVGTARSGVV